MTVSIELHQRLRIDGLQLIQIKISNHGKRHRIASEIYVKKTQFNKKAKWGRWIKEIHPDAAQLNKKLETKINNIRNHYEQNNIINPKAAIKGNSFFAFADDFIEKYNNDNNIGTYEGYQAKLNKLKKYAGDQLTFNQVNVNFIRNYINHLTIEHNNSVNGYSVDLKKIRAIYNQAAKEGIANKDTNPFDHIKIKTEKTGKERLNKKEIDLIRKLEFKPNSYWWHARNIFLFCINMMGMRIGDAMRFKWDNIHGNEAVYSMRKSKDPIRIELTREAKKIIGYYKNQTKYYVFPYLQKGDHEYYTVKRKTALVNGTLRKIVKKAGITKHISTHVSRHSYTQLALDAGADLRTLQKAFGHETSKTTEVYVSEVDSREVNKLNKAIFK